MSVQSTARYAGPFAGNGVTTVFAFGFKVFATSDIVVASTVVATGVVSTPINGTDYTVQLNADQNANPGGTITYAVAPPATVSFYVTSSIPKAQGSQFPNPGPWNPTTAEAAWDKGTAIIQEIGQAALLFAPGDVASTHILPSPAARAGKSLFFDAAGVLAVGAVIGALSTTVVGQIPFGAAANTLGQDANLFWDNTNKRLGIGNAAPTKTLDVTGAIKASSDANSAAIIFAASSVTNWNSRNAADNAYSSAFYDATQHIFKVGGAEAWRFDPGKNLITGTDNSFDIGAAGATRPRTGYFGTSVVTPLVTSSGSALQLFAPTANVLQFGANNTLMWQLQTAGHLLPVTGDNVQDFGDATHRIRQLFTPIIDSGTTGSLLLKTNNGGIGLRIDNIASAVVQYAAIPDVTGGKPRFVAVGEATVGATLGTAGSGDVDLVTSNTEVQTRILRTASANRFITLTGSNGGNPTIGVTAGSLAITPNVVIAGNLNVGNSSATPGSNEIVFGGNGTAILRVRNNANSGDVILAQVATQVANDIVNIGVGGNGVYLKARSGGAAPTTTDLPAGLFTVWRDTGGATTKIYYNNAGTIQASVAFT